MSRKLKIGDTVYRPKTSVELGYHYGEKIKIAKCPNGSDLITSGVVRGMEDDNELGITFVIIEYGIDDNDDGGLLLEAFKWNRKYKRFDYDPN